MKDAYEGRTRFMLPRRTFTVIRVDGKSFHTLTRGYEKPTDERIEAAMDGVAVELCHHIQGATMAYAQSDEVSVLVGDFMTIRTDAWFDGNVQKMASVAASIATRAFNSVESGNALFDARVFTIPDAVEVENYFIWRQQDAVRNSIQGLAQSRFSHKECHGKNTSELQDMLMGQCGINWNDCTPRQKRGRVIRREGTAEAMAWIVDEETPIFTADRDYLKRNFPARQD